MHLDWGKQIGALPLGGWVVVVGGGLGIALYSRSVSSDTAKTDKPAPIQNNDVGRGAGRFAYAPNYRESPHKSDPSPNSPGDYYTTQKGDTLRIISHFYYGSQSRWHEIFNANRNTKKLPNGRRGALSNPLIIPVGIDLWLPPKQHQRRIDPQPPRR